MTDKPLHVQVAERIKARIVAAPSGCWEWQGYRDRKGYGRFSLKDRPVVVARAAYEAFVGPIPVGYTIDHLCRNPPCVNPAHLQPVTRGENTLRGHTLTAELKAKTHCPAGHDYDGRNTYVDRRGRRSCKECKRAEQRTPEAKARNTAYRRARRRALKAAGKLGA